MDLSVSNWMKEARVTLPCALAWRAMTELARRHHLDCEIAIEQFHPGASARGAYGLWLRGGRAGESPIQVSFHLGGPSGTWSTGWPESTGNLADLLLPEPARAIDQIEQAARLPPAPSPVPPSTQSVLGMRLVTAVLESLVFRKESWRASLGAYGYDGSTTVADWVHHLGVEGAGLNPGRAMSERLSECVLIHSTPGEDPVMVQAQLAGPALLIDLRTGVIGRLDAGGWEKVHQLGISTGFSANSLHLLVAKLVGPLG